MKERNAMEDKFLNPLPCNDDTVEVAMSVRDVPPAHYTFKIESFSVLSQILLDTGVDKYESGDFEAGGYKWRLLLYPNGNKKRNGMGHISLYLVLSETNTLPLGWEVKVIFKFFVFDQIRDKYFTFQDVDGKVKRFHGMKTEWGFTQMLPLSSFNDASNGYLIDDCCAFGAEVFVINCTGKGENISIIKEPENGTLTLKIDEFSGLSDGAYFSEVFTIGEHKWSLSFHPKGASVEKHKYVSIYLELHSGSTLRPGQNLYIEYKLRIRDQVLSDHYELGVKKWFSASIGSWGYERFMLLSDLLGTSRGFIVNDTLIVEGEITLMSTVKDFS